METSPRAGKAVASYPEDDHLHTARMEASHPYLLDTPRNTSSTEKFPAEPCGTVMPPDGARRCACQPNNTASAGEHRASEIRRVRSWESPASGVNGGPLTDWEPLWAAMPMVLSRRAIPGGTGAVCRDGACRTTMARSVRATSVVASERAGGRAGGRALAPAPCRANYAVGDSTVHV